MEAPKLLSVSDFLAWDARQEDRFELLDGIIVAMASPSRRHAALIRRLYRTIERACGERCDVYVGDMTVRIEQTLRHNAPKPDIVVTCDEHDRRPEDLSLATISYPKVVVEVLSPTTAASDLNSKSIVTSRFRRSKSTCASIRASVSRYYTGVAVPTKLSRHGRHR